MENRIQKINRKNNSSLPHLRGNSSLAPVEIINQNSSSFNSDNSSILTDDADEETIVDFDLSPRSVKMVEFSQPSPATVLNVNSQLAASSNDDHSQSPTAINSVRSKRARKMIDDSSSFESESPMLDLTKLKETNNERSTSVARINHSSQSTSQKIQSSAKISDPYESYSDNEMDEHFLNNEFFTEKLNLEQKKSTIQLNINLTEDSEKKESTEKIKRKRINANSHLHSPKSKMNKSNYFSSPSIVHGPASNLRHHDISNDPANIAANKFLDYGKKFINSASFAQMDCFDWYEKFILLKKKMKRHVSLILTEPPQNNLIDENGKILMEDQFSKQQMLKFAEMVDYFLTDDGTAVIFCSSIQHSEWNEIFSNRTKFPSLIIEPNLLLFILSPNKIPQQNESNEIVNVVQSAIIVHRKNWSPNFTDSKRSGKFPNFTNVINGVIPCETFLQHDSHIEIQNELFNEIPSQDSERRHLYQMKDSNYNSRKNEFKQFNFTHEINFKKFQSQQKSEYYIDPPIKMFSKKGDIIYDPFAGSFSTGERAIVHERRFCGQELNFYRFTSGVARVFNSFCTEQQKNSLPRIISPLSNKISNSFNCLCCTIQLDHQNLSFCNEYCKKAYNGVVDRLNNISMQPEQQQAKLRLLPSFVPGHILNAWRKDSSNSTEDDLNSKYILDFPAGFYNYDPEKILSNDNLKIFFDAESVHFGGKFEVKIDPLLENQGFGVYATQNIQKNEIITIIFGQIVWITVGKAKTEPTKDSDEFKNGMRNRLMILDKVELDSIYSDFPLIHNLIKKIENNINLENKKLGEAKESEDDKNDDEIQSYLSIHDLSAAGRVNSSIGAGDYALISEKPDKMKEIICTIYSITKEKPQIISADQKIIQLNITPNAEFLFNPMSNKKSLEILCKEQQIPPFATLNVKAIRNINAEEQIFIKYDYIEMPDQNLVDDIMKNKEKFELFKVTNPGNLFTFPRKNNIIEKPRQLICWKKRRPENNNGNRFVNSQEDDEFKSNYSLKEIQKSQNIRQNSLRSSTKKIRKEELENKEKEHEEE